VLYPHSPFGHVVRLGGHKGTEMPGESESQV